MAPRIRPGALGTLLLCVALTVLAAGDDKPLLTSKPDAADNCSHPLDPLTPEEIQQAVEILRWELKLPEHVRFPAVVLHEPPKDEVLRWEKGAGAAPLPRRAWVIAYDHRSNQTTEAVIDLGTAQVRECRRRHDVQPVIMAEEYDLVRRVVLADERVQKALARRGLHGKDVQAEAWASGIPCGDARHRTARLIRVVFHVGGPESSNTYGQPIEGLMALVDCNQRAVLEVVDAPGIPAIKGARHFYDPSMINPRRSAPHPLKTTQPEGPSFALRGQEVRWQNWCFRFANHPREALVLYRVCYHEPGQAEPRSVLYRASLSEMVVPYGDPSPFWHWRAAFDMGEYGFGRLSTTLHRGQEVPDHAVLLDSVFADELGGSVVVPDSIAIYERDAGMLWRHYDTRTDRRECRRGRELVLTQVLTVGNYDYGLNWIFGQDGQVRVEVELTGILQVKGVKAQTCERCRLELKPGAAVEPTGEDRYGTLVAPQLVAVNHQHLFCFRLDVDVDGVANSVSEMQVQAAPSDAGNAFLMTETLLPTEALGRRHFLAEKHTRWKVFSGQRNEQGHRTGYVLEPGPAAAVYLADHALVRQRAAFLNYSLWVTRYRTEELYAAGDYPNQSRGGDGLPQYSNGEAVVETDIVLWHTLGVTHIPRPEEWPVMPTARVGFRLIPDGFFARNPALDVP